MVFGGDDLALEWALELAEHRPAVTLLHRRAQLQAQPDLLARARAAGPAQSSLSREAAR